jgi:uncharacterized protein YqeY
MSMMQRIGDDLSAAMKARDQGRLAPLRMAKAALMNKEVEKGPRPICLRRSTLRRSKRRSMPR